MCDSHGLFRQKRQFFALAAFGGSALIGVIVAAVVKMYIELENIKLQNIKNQMHIKVLQENLQENNYGFVKLPILLAVCKYSNLNMLEALRKEIDDTEQFAYNIGVANEILHTMEASKFAIRMLA